MASGFTTLTNENLIRANLYSRQLKELLLDDLYVYGLMCKVLTEFPDGTTFNIPSVGEAETADFAEGQAIKYNAMDTGNFTFSFDTYKYSANSMSAKFKRDSFWSSDVEAMFVPRQHRALMEAVETDILSCVNKATGQTASDLNTINGGNHRFVAGGTNEVFEPADFFRARYALTKAQVPLNRLVAIVDPSVTFALETQSNITSLLSPYAMAEDIYKRALVTGYKFRYNFAGWDIYVSNYLPSGIAETINSVSVTTGVANQLFAAGDGNDIMPIIGGFRQMPTVYSEFNKDLQQDEYLTISEWGFKMYRPENMVCILSDTDQVV